MLRQYIAIALLVLMLGGTADAKVWKIDNYHSQAVFTIEHISGKVTGFFNSFEGTVTDPHLSSGNINISIDVGSINSGIEKRDAHLKTPDFFDAPIYPAITFKSHSIKDIRSGWYEAHGTLTIKNVSKNIILPFTLFEIKPHPFPDMKCFEVLGFEAHYALNRLDFGVGTGKFHKMGIVGDSVSITLVGELLAKQEGCH